MTAAETVKQIRERYPEVATPTCGKYCVLGAAGKYCRPGFFTPFPPKFYGAMILRMLNPRLGLGLSEDHASRISWIIDSGDFEAAWKALEEALGYGTDEPETKNL